ncbi:uncharacterized protein NPIL_637231 [Nephila pilipes]|uniref:Uncharacterized protein n=1 Tax=Nephila pilipes TaxID=299642 RepID=A0A8X6T2C6_NEPPI|nr:uncharacterized protein NPIL_637231 [Nephila pilipes]
MKDRHQPSESISVSIADENGQPKIVATRDGDSAKFSFKANSNEVKLEFEIHMEKSYGYLIIEYNGTYIYHMHGILFRDIVSCMKIAIEPKIDDGNIVFYFRISENLGIIKYLHNVKKGQSYSFTYLHHLILPEPYYTYCAN